MWHGIYFTVTGNDLPITVIDIYLFFSLVSICCVVGDGWEVPPEPVLGGPGTLAGCEQSNLKCQLGHPDTAS